MNKCIGCVNCIKCCPTESIRLRVGRPEFIREYCTDCGECIRQCPTDAMLTRRSHIDILEQFEYTVALPDPSLYSQFNSLEDINIVLTALKMMGFDDVFDVSAAAELISLQTREYIDNNRDKWPIISSDCPSVERIIRVKFPELVDHLLPFLPPQEVAAKLARAKAIADTGLPTKHIGIIFISPCPAKISYSSAPMGVEESEIDGSLAIKDIYAILLSYMPRAKKAPEQLQQSGRTGVRWAISGGEARGSGSDNFLYADGITNVLNVLEDLEDEKMNPELNFIELTACSGGCVGGVLQVENTYAARAKMIYINSFLNDDNIDTVSERINPNNMSIGWTENVTYEPVYAFGDNFIENMRNLEAVEKLHNELPRIDCSVCGAPTCKAFAGDVIRGRAKETDCIYRLRDSDTSARRIERLKEIYNENRRTKKP